MGQDSSVTSSIQLFEHLSIHCDLLDCICMDHEDKKTLERFGWLLILFTLFLMVALLLS